MKTNLKMKLKNFFHKCSLFLVRIKCFYHKYKLIILGFIIFSLYFWNRFLKKRKSKDLPLNLSLIGFFTIFYICMIFLYIIISLLITKGSNPTIELIVDWLFIPIMEFDKYLKNISFIKKRYKSFMKYIIPKLDPVIIKTNTLYILLWIIPRLILLTALFIDVFLFHKFHYKYQVILIGLLLFLNRYFKHTLKMYKLELLAELKLVVSNVTTTYYPYVHPSELEPDYDPEDEDNIYWPPTMCLPLDIFIEHETKSIVYNNITNSMDIYYNYDIIRDIVLKHLGISINEENNIELMLKQGLDKELNLLLQRGNVNEIEYMFKNGRVNKKVYHEKFWLVSKKVDKKYDPEVQYLLKISLLLEYYSKTSNQNNKIKIMKIVVYSVYLICWTYVLFISIKTLDTNELIKVINQTWENIENPFI